MEKVKSLSEKLSVQPIHNAFKVWIVGDTPLITHAWSEKARREMLQKQIKATKPGKEARDPEEDFRNSLYEMAPGIYGFPSTGVKNSLLSAAHKDKGIARTAVQSALWIDANMSRVRPALAGAICDVPLVRIWGSDPEMREDMVRIGSGMNKTANLAYRGQFTHWAMLITGHFDPTVIKEETLGFLISGGGRSIGLGEWRPEKKGPFGAYHLAIMEEEQEWEAFASGKGPLPVADNYLQEAAE